MTNLAKELAVVPSAKPENIMRPTPFTVVIDTREQLAFAFASPLSDSRRGSMVVQTTVRTLPSGDYSLAGYETRLAVERKGLSDLFGTLATGRARFTGELERLSTYDFSAVVVEADWSEICERPPARSRLRPTTIFHSVIAWQQRFPKTHWWMCPGRAVAEAVTIRILDRFWREKMEKV